MAKPQRMFIMTVACLYCAAAPTAWQQGSRNGWGVMALTLAVVFAGSLLTSWRRLVRIARILKGTSC
jgi:hypothetical protein